MQLDIAIPPIDALAGVMNAGVQDLALTGNRHDYAAPSPVDAVDAEAIAFNLEASQRVFNEHHLFTWTQGLLQNLIRHDVLICMMRKGDTELFTVESFSTQFAESNHIGELYLREPAFADGMVKDWEAQRYQPLVRDLGGNTNGGDGNWRGSGIVESELSRIGTQRVIGHGTYDPNGRTNSFFAFACHTEDAGPRQLQLVSMMVPFLHSAWLRTKVNLTGERKESNVQAGARDLLTQREHEVLKWVYLGKSNLEIGMILGISPLTVKNHVQEILRRLDVQNRTQAVGKALKLRILVC